MKATRRAVVAASGAAALGLAGCTSDGSSSTPPPTGSGESSATEPTGGRSRPGRPGPRGRDHHQPAGRPGRGTARARPGRPPRRDALGSPGRAAGRAGRVRDPERAGSWGAPAHPRQAAPARAARPGASSRAWRWRPRAGRSPGCSPACPPASPRPWPAGTGWPHDGRGPADRARRRARGPLRVRRPRRAYLRVGHARHCSPRSPGPTRRTAPSATCSPDGSSTRGRSRHRRRRRTSCRRRRRPSASHAAAADLEAGCAETYAYVVANTVRRRPALGHRGTDRRRGPSGGVRSPSRALPRRARPQLSRCPRARLRKSTRMAGLVIPSTPKPVKTVSSVVTTAPSS